MLIGITGKKRSGKDTIASLLEVHKFKRLSFADPIKNIGRIFGFTEEELNGEKKEVLNEYWNITPRKFMQIVGTEMFRTHFRSDVWLKMMEYRMSLYKGNIVIPDIRFYNEADFIISHGGELWQVTRPMPEYSGHEEDSHVSETALDGNIISKRFENTGTIEDLYRIIMEYTSKKGMF